MKWIGLTGSLGTGKSTVTKILRSLGFTVLDADALAHEALAVGTDPYWQVLQDFGHDLRVSDDDVRKAGLSSSSSSGSGSSIVGAGSPTVGSGSVLQVGAIDRRKLAALVFGKPEQLARLEKIIHPFVRAKVAEAKAQHGVGESAKVVGQVHAKALFYDVPLLFEKNMQKDFDEVWVVSCSEDLQRSRLKSGRGFTDEEITRRLSHQVPLSEKVRRANAVIDNNGDEVQLLKNVEKILMERGLV